MHKYKNPKLYKYNVDIRFRKNFPRMLNVVQKETKGVHN